MKIKLVKEKLSRGVFNFIFQLIIGYIIGIRGLILWYEIIRGKKDKEELYKLIDRGNIFIL